MDISDHFFDFFMSIREDFAVGRSVYYIWEDTPKAQRTGQHLRWRARARRRFIVCDFVACMCLLKGGRKGGEAEMHRWNRRIESYQDIEFQLSKCVCLLPRVVAMTSQPAAAVLRSAF